MGIWGILVTNGLDFEFAFNGLFFTILVEMVFLTDYVIILAKKKSLLDEEVSKQDYAKKLCKIKFESVGSGLIFFITFHLLRSAVILHDNAGFVNEFFNIGNLIIHLVAGILFGFYIYFYEKRNLLKLEDEKK